MNNLLVTCTFVGDYTTKTGKLMYKFKTNLSSFMVKAENCDFVPDVNNHYIASVSAILYDGKAFLGYSVREV